MEAVLEAKFVENLSWFSKNSYYSLYSLKVNRSNSIRSDKIVLDQNHNSTVAQFLDKEAMVNKDFSLTSLLSNLPEVNASFLREALARKIEKGTMYASTNGSIAAFNLGFRSDDTELESICYFNLYRQQSEPFGEFLICFTLEDSKQNLDLFRNELDFFFNKYIESYLARNSQDELKALEEKYLKNWYDYAVKYLNRPIELLNENIAVIFEEAFSCGDFDLDKNLDEKTTMDFEFLLRDLNCHFLAYTSTEQSAIQVNQKLSITTSGDSNKLILSKSYCSAFTQDIAKKLVDKYYEDQDPFALKQIIEFSKTIFVQELNLFNRLLRRAESNHYDAYKAQLFLKECTMSRALISTITKSFNVNTQSGLNLSRLFGVLIDFYNKNAKF